MTYPNWKGLRMTVPQTSDTPTLAPERGVKLPMSVSYMSLGSHLIAVATGVVLLLAFQNAVGKEVVTFSTSSLISFLFGIALSAASTILAVAAISLGKT